ncbi:hypothetical protein F2P56_011313 [Juglans regia]|uniref:Reverse transcriptase zinc-binding domain-containing protein n=1 Tax=Juglans regia TaxID=51240 RepID=A0A833XTC5_JUGRE|nr:hypothetical protein F2P56_011313 [Juglans regia]
MEATPATRMFILRVCSEALPTLANLRRRKIAEDSTCLICRQCPEMSGHALWGCPAAQDVWNQCVKRVQKMSVHSDLFIDIWVELVHHLEPIELAEVATILREELQEFVW